MARKTTLVRLLDLYRAECRLSLNPAHNPQVRDTQVNHIQRMQEWLWSDYAWPLLRVERNIDIQNGQRYYSMPADLDIDRITKVEVRDANVFTPMCAGIDACHYAAVDSDLGIRQWPPQRWRISEDEQFEVWPVPDVDFDPATLQGRIKVTGIRKLKKLVDDGDRADLDDRLIILYCAAEHLAASGAKDASLKLDQAKSLHSRLKGQQRPRRVMNMFGVDQQRHVRRVPIAIYNKPA